MIIKFRGMQSDGVIKDFEKELSDLNSLKIEIQYGKLAIYSVKFNNRIYRVNKNNFFKVIKKLPELNLTDIDFS
ncbi:MAG: hypothetical protein [Bacteriophage sp.]|nr:MAG: hypothetical protein [Bacteriophage sp.]